MTPPARFTFRRIAAAAIIIAGSMVCEPATSQDESSGEFRLPTDPTMWLNSMPLSSEALAGKGAVLWFYEEGCPRCRERWPALLQTAKKFEGQPVVFIAINSGNERADVAHYAREVGCNWPIIVDESRQFEKAAGLDNEVSLQNIYQCRVLTADGRLVGGNPGNMDQTAETALAGAEWRVDPAGIPAALRSAWVSIELGNPGPAAAAIKKGLSSPKADLKAGATKLNEAVQSDIQKLVDEAKQADASGNKWQAYKSYQTAATKYAGYTLPPEVPTALKELPLDEGVKKEILAQKNLETAIKLARSSSAGTRRSAIQRIKKISEDFAGTEAAEQAQKLLSQAAQ
jgi:thiol-disulfide isomerase/thioredoxin